MAKRSVFLFIALCFVFFLDNPLSVWLTQLLDNRWFFSSYLILVVIFHLSRHIPSFWQFPIAIVLGIFYDAHYFGTLGLSVWLFPILVYLLGHSWRLIAENVFKQLLIFLFTVLVFAVGNYTLARLYGLTTYSLEAFVVINLLPSLGLSCFYFLAGKAFVKLKEK